MTRHRQPAIPLLLMLLISGCAGAKIQQELTLGTRIEDVRAKANQGDVTAQFMLGKMHEEGHEVPQSFTEALKWYQSSAKQGHLGAQSTLGYLYQYGEGVKQDLQAALVWNRKAAERGDPFAQHNLAVMYDFGDGVAEDDIEAVKWYRLAADQGYYRSQLNLGICYWQGQGVPRNYAQAYELLNHVRMTAPDRQARWKARGVLDEMRKSVPGSGGTR